MRGCTDPRAVRSIANWLGRVNEGLRRVFKPAYDFVLKHEDRWEVLMAILAIAFVATGFAGDFFPRYASLMDGFDAVLTIVFIAEFGSRFTGSPSRLKYLKNHLLDLVALIPLARGVRLFRLLRLLRLARTFKGIHRVFTRADRLANHHEFGTLVIAWFGTMFFCASAFFVAESEVNPAMEEPGDAIWWGIAMLTGGTTDVRAVTEEGRLITAVLLVFGVALFTAITAVLVSFLVRPGQAMAEATTATARQTDQRLDASTLLRELIELRDSHLITESEYSERRAAVLSRFHA